MKEMKYFQNMELDDDVLNTVSGGIGSVSGGCYEPGDTIHFKISCPACGRQCDDKYGFVATVQKRFQCDGKRDMVQIQVDHCGGSVVKWIDHT